MTKRITAALFAALVWGGLTAWANAADDIVPSPKTEEVCELMQRVNAWQVAHPWRETDRNWIRATWYTGVMAAYKATGDASYLQQAMAWGEKHGFQPGTERAGGNVLTCGQTWLELYTIQQDSRMLDPMVQWIDSARDNTPTGKMDAWYLEGGRRYADSLYVGPPTLAMLAELTGDAKYLKYMDDFFWDVHAELFDEQDGLFYRDKRYRQADPGQRVAFEDIANHQESRKSDVYQISKRGNKVFWSRGNGWVIAGIPRILQHLPEDHPSRPKYVELLKTMAQALRQRQGPDGYWRANLDDPTDFPMPECSGTGFFVSAMAWGVNQGVLPADDFVPVIAKAWRALAQAVRDDGMVQWGQLVGAGPYQVRKEDSHEYVTGTFLLAGSEVLKLTGSRLAGDE